MLENIVPNVQGTVHLCREEYGRTCRRPTPIGQVRLVVSGTEEVTSHCGIKTHFLVIFIL